MAELSLLTKEDLTAIGLNAADRAAFIDFRVRNGAINTPEAIERLTKALSASGAKALNTAMRTQGVVSTQAPLNNVELRLVPNPPMLSDPGMTVTIAIHRQVDVAAHEGTLPFTLSGETRIPLADVSLDHLIHIEIKTAAGDVIHERVLAPVQQVTGEIVGTTWVATPPIGTGESLIQNGKTLAARLLIDTLRPAAAAPKPAAAQPVFARNGRFVVIGQPDFGFSGYALGVALANTALLNAIAGSLDTSAGSVAAMARFAPGDPRFVALLGALPLGAGEIDYAGTFRVRQENPALSGVKGWVWVLTGPDSVVGFRPDPAPDQPAPEALIYLPSDLVAQPTSGLPTDATEAALLARPDLFTDDPGSSCRPFSSPGRVLGEKRFRTVLRVTQPQVARAGLTPITFEGQDQRPIAFPRLGVNPTNEVDYEGDPARFQAQGVAFGHILEHVVRYRSNGYSLGNVAHSLTLAPREKRRIMKVDFARSESARRTESTASADEVSDSLDYNRDYDNAVEGSLGEWSRGSSSASAFGAAAGAGGLAGPVVIGGGLSGGGSQTNATQQSHRDTAARESQRLRDALRRHGESLRKIESTVVTENTQTESVTGVSEVVQNINYTRALSIVYYEILRHLRVDTEIGAVSECVFVPMPIRPFTDARISRHRKVLARFARGWLEKAVFDYLDDIQSNFAASDIPDDERRKQPLIRLSGKFTMTMGINIPAGGTGTPPVTSDDEAALHRTNAALEEAWAPFAALLPSPVSIIAAAFNERRSNPGEAERFFRKQVAPTMMRRFLESLVLVGPDGPLAMDVTPSGGYSRGAAFEVFFEIDLDGSVNRHMLENLKLHVSPDAALPPGSYLNLTGARIDYASDHYEASATRRGPKSDLLDTATGRADISGAMVDFPATEADKMNLRDRLRDGYAALKKTLEANTFRYHKAIWAGIDRDELYALLDGYALSDTDGRSIASVIEREPLGVLGNSLVFATRTDWPLDELYSSFADLKAHYTSGLPMADPIRISLPTSGLYARAHMDECVAAEEHNGSFDWVFDNAEPDLAEFPTSMFDSRATPAQNLTPTAFPDTIINLQNAPAAPSPTGLASTLATLGTDAFRDNTGLAGTQENLRAAMSNATSLANSGMSQAAHFAQLASDARAGKDLTTFSAATKKAVERGQMSPEAAQKANDDMAARKAAGQTGAGNDLHAKVLATDGEASHSSTGSDGSTQTTTKKASTRKEPKSNLYVVPIPDSNQVLFMNFATGKSELQPQHVQFLEKLGPSIGASLDDLVSMEGHASTSGGEDSNFDLGANRALALYDRLRRFALPLGGPRDYSPAAVSSTGEQGSYRARFSHIPAIAAVQGQGDPNDPVEKAVLFTFKPGTNVAPVPDVTRFGGLDVTVINNYLIVAGRIYCSLPGGELKVMDRSTVEILSNNEVTTEIKTGDANIAVEVGPVTVAPTTNISGSSLFNFSFSLFNGNSLNFTPDPATGIIGAPTITPPLSEQERDDWQIKLFEPQISANAVSIESLLRQLAGLVLDFAIAGTSLAANAPPIVKAIVGIATGVQGDSAVAATDKGGKVYDLILKELGLDGIKALLGLMRFGSISMGGQIAVAGTAAMLEGTFTGPGLIVGTTGVTKPPPPILNNAPYTTSKKLQLVQWPHQSQNFQRFAFIDNGPIAGGLAAHLAFDLVTKGISSMATQFLPEFMEGAANAVLDGLKAKFLELHTALSAYGANPSLTFKAFASDDPAQIQKDNIIPTGAELRVMAMTPGKITFTAGPRPS